MSETQYINDDFGNKIPLLDGSGNLSLQVIMLYTEDKLTSADRKVVDDFASADDFTRDALDGYAITSNASKTRFSVGELNSSIQKRTGAKAVSTLVPKEKSQFDFRKLAAAITILVILGGTTFFATQFFKEENLALEEKASEEPTTADEQKNNLNNVKSQTIQFDTLADQSLSQDKLQVAEDDLLKGPQEPKETTVRTKQTLVAEKPVVNLEEVKDLQLSAEPEEEETVAELASIDVDESVLEENASGMLSNADEMALNQVIVVEQPVVPMLKEKEEADFSAELAAESKRKEREAITSALSTREAEESMRAEENAQYAEELLVSRQAAEAKSMEAALAPEEQAEKLADQTARFPGGDIKMYRFIERKKNYTQAMRNQGLNGTVTVSFDIEVDGRITNTKVKSGITGILDQDALRVIRSMPKWEPAIRGGSTVRSSKSVVVKYGD